MDDTKEDVSLDVKDVEMMRKGLSVDLRCAAVVMHLVKEDDSILRSISEKLGGAVSVESVKSDVTIATALVDFFVQTPAVQEAVMEIMCELRVQAKRLKLAKDDR